MTLVGEHSNLTGLPQACDFLYRRIQDTCEIGIGNCKGESFFHIFMRLVNEIW